MNEVKTDASDLAKAASLTQNEHLVVFFFRTTLSQTEEQHSALEPKAQAFVESIKKCTLFFTEKAFSAFDRSENSVVYLRFKTRQQKP